MSKKIPEPELFHTFFKEGTVDLFASEQPEETLASEMETGPQLPLFPTSGAKGEQGLKAHWRALRLFLRSAKGGGIIDAENRLLAFPAALAPFRDQAFFEKNYPCWLGEGLEAALVPVHELLQQTLLQFAPEDAQAVFLKKQIPVLEQLVREECQKSQQAIPAHEVWDAALDTLQKQFEVQDGAKNPYLDDLLNLRKKLPKSGWVLPFSLQTPLVLLAALIHDHATFYKREMEKEITRLAGRLSELLAVEREKSSEAHSAEQLQESMDFADSFLDFDEMSNLLPESGAENMPEERLRRLEKALETLQKADELLFAHSVVFVAEKELELTRTFDWKTFFPKAQLHRVEGGEVAPKALDLFDQHTEKAAKLYAALRIAQLEVDDQYNPELHDDFFAHFSWRRFSEKEMAACPPVVLCVDSNALLNQEWNTYSHILASNRPVKALVLKKAGELDVEEVAFRQEPGALAIAHRDAFVLQSAAVQPNALYQGLKEGLNGAFPAMFHILSPASDYSILNNSAAVEGREFPGFTFNFRLGPKWGSRFDIQHNPDISSDWPLVSFDFQREDSSEEKMEMPFTYADYSALNPSFSKYFHLVPAEYWTEDLVPVAEYLNLPEEDRYRKVPFIWMVNTANELVKAAVAWPLIEVCQERLDFWHFLQENAGIHSYHVEQATDQLRRELEAVQKEKIEALKAAHETKIAEARETAARDAMEQLASVLLDLDTSEIAATPKQKVVSQPAPEVEQKAEPEEAQAEEAASQQEEEVEISALGEAWIETSECTTCDECIGINNDIFKYNADKLAYVADPKAGTFADIVKAAESCPVAIIHPGAPQNPNEPGLEALVKKAEAFN